MTDKEYTDIQHIVMSRLAITRSNFAASIRQCQVYGLTPDEIQTVLGINDVTYAQLIVDWGLDK